MACQREKVKKRKREKWVYKQQKIEKEQAKREANTRRGSWLSAFRLSCDKCLLAQRQKQHHRCSSRLSFDPVTPSRKTEALQTQCIILIHLNVKQQLICPITLILLIGLRHRCRGIQQASEIDLFLNCHRCYTTLYFYYYYSSEMCASQSSWDQEESPNRKASVAQSSLHVVVAVVGERWRRLGKRGIELCMYVCACVTFDLSSALSSRDKSKFIWCPTIMYTDLGES